MFCSLGDKRQYSPYYFKILSPREQRRLYFYLEITDKLEILILGVSLLKKVKL